MTECASALLEDLARELMLRRELEQLAERTARAYRALTPAEQAQVCRHLGLLDTGPRAEGQIEG